MAKTIAWHAEKETVYHDNNKCQQADMIQATKRVKGTADRPQCPQCEQLDLETK
jgi:hypothetical protein